MKVTQDRWENAGDMKGRVVLLVSRIGRLGYFVNKIIIHYRQEEAMKTKILLFGTLVLSLLVFIVGSSWAAGGECLAPKKKITIVSPSGEVIEICVSEAAIPHIGGRGDIVISASCPCFTLDDIQAVQERYTDIVCSRYDGTSTVTGESCTYIECYNGDYSFYSEALQGPLDRTTSGHCLFEGRWSFKVDSNNFCYWEDAGSWIWSESLTEAEGDACVAVINTLVP